MASVYLKKNEENRIKKGHLWVFSNETGRTAGIADTGDIVDVFDYRGELLGHGFYNKNSLVSVRLLSSDFSGDINTYIKQFLLNARDLREQVYPGRTSYRLCFSESDYLPGLIIDKYNNSFVLQVYSAGMEKNIEQVVNVLKNEMLADNIFTINDPWFRKLEGLEETDKIYFGKVNDEIISDGLIKYHINFTTAQKTGFYFDQSDNRYMLSRFAVNKKVLDGFCNQGGFGLHAASSGAAHVTFADSSAIQINNVKRNIELNNIRTYCDFITSDLFDYLEKCIAEGMKFDIINLDPPAFAKNKRSVPAALKGYEKLNRLALQCIKSGGLLASSSCSHHVEKESFLTAINKAASKINAKLQMIYYNTASLDHPSLLSMPETAYLKFSVFRVI